MMNLLLATIVILLFLLTYPFVLLHKLISLIFLKNKLKNIENEIAVVTGAGHGLGRAIAIELARKGCHIAVVDINLDGANETVNTIKNQFNVQAKSYKVDLQNYNEIVELNENVTKDLGITTILVNNAGMLMFQNAIKPDFNEIQSMININLTSHFVTNQVFLTKMKELNKGHIVATSSLAGVFPLIQNDVYTGTKFGVRGLMKVLRLNLDFENYKINTTTVLPSFLNTNDEVSTIAKKIGYTSLATLIKGQELAERIVNGIQKNDLEIFAPSALAVIYRLYEFLPVGLQNSLICLLGNKFIDKFNDYLKNRKIYK